MAVAGAEHVTQCIDLVRELTKLVEEAPKSFVFSDKFSLPRKDVTDRLQLMQASLPEAIKTAQTIIEQESDIIEDARKKAEVTIADANNQAEGIVAAAREELIRLQNDIELSKKEAERIQAESMRQAEEMARQAQANADNILKQAQQQAQQLVNAGEVRAQELISQDNIYRRATAKANELTEKTNAEMADLRKKTFAYLDDMLGQAEHYVNGLMTDIRQERDNVNSVRQQ